MARPEKNTVEYFPFICEDGNKMFYIEETYGNDGFATFVKLLRELAKTNYHYLDLSKPTTQMFLSAKCKISKETLLSIIKDLVELGKFDKALWNENNIIWCQDFIDSIQDAYNKRKNKCITYEGLLLHLQSLGVRKQGLTVKKQTNNTQTILDYSKEDKKKQNEDIFISSDSAYDFLKKEHPTTMESFEMQNKKSFVNYDVFIQNFESKIIEEGIPFESDKLYARLTRLLANWNFKPKNEQSNQNQPVQRIEKRNYF